MHKKSSVVLLVIFAMLVAMAVAGLTSYTQTRESRERYNSLPIAETAHAPRTPRILNINRFYSDIDGREIANPRIRLSGGTEVVGSVIVRQLPDNTWQVKIKPDDADKGGLTVIVDVVTESATYFDLGPSPDNPGAIRS